MNLRRLLWNKLTLTLLVLLIAGAAALLWRHEHKPSLEQRYEVQPVATGDLTQTVSANGTLNPVVLVNVGTQVSGTVKKLFVDFNDQVKKGQVLVELDASLFQAQVQQSEANVHNAEASLELAETSEKRMRELYRQEYVSKQELDQAMQTFKSAQAQLALARAQMQKDRTNLAYTVIRSPVSGVVVSREVDVGQTVAASFQTPTLFKIAQDLRQMQIDSSFAEADIGNIRVGQAARFTVDAFPNHTFNGTVKQVRLNPTTQQNVVTYNVVVRLDNPDKILMPGMTAYVNIAVAEREDALLVPNAALRFRPQDGVRKGERKPEQGGKREKKDTAGGTVYVLENEQLRPVRIVPGITDNKFTEVLSGGLKAGDRVVVGEAQQSGAPADATRGNFRMRMF